MFLGEIDGVDKVVEGKDWVKECFGSFYIKLNYLGCSSYVCNVGFLVIDVLCNCGVGRFMGEVYIDWVFCFGYIYSVFNFVYEINVVLCCIWDVLGFKCIGCVKGCGNLKSYLGCFVDVIIYGCDFVLGESEDFVSEECFDKIKYYLKYGKYFNGVDCVEKSRLCSVVIYYKLIEGDKFMLKDKEVIFDFVR